MFGIPWTGSSQLFFSVSSSERDRAYADANINGRLKGNVFVHEIFESESLALRGRGGNGESAPRVEVGDVSATQLAMDSQRVRTLTRVGVLREVALGSWIPRSLSGPESPASVSIAHTSRPEYTFDKVGR